MFAAIAKSSATNAPAASRTPGNCVSELSDRCLIGYVEAEHLLSPHSGHSTPAAAERLAAQIWRRCRSPTASTISPSGARRARAAFPPRRACIGAAAAMRIRRRPIRRSSPPRHAPCSRGSTTRSSRISRTRRTLSLQTLAAELLGPAWPMSHGSPSRLPPPIWPKAWIGRPTISPRRCPTQHDRSRRCSTGARASPPSAWDNMAMRPIISKHWPRRPRCRAGPARPRRSGPHAAIMQARNPRLVLSLLMAAAREEPTFYGLLAERILGGRPAREFRSPTLTAKAFAALMRVPAAHRAVALWQVGRTRRRPQRDEPCLRRDPPERRHRLCRPRQAHGAAQSRIARQRNRSLARRSC